MCVIVFTLGKILQHLKRSAQVISQYLATPNIVHLEFPIVKIVIMPSSEKFRKILSEDGYTYVITSKDTEGIYLNFPNLPDHHTEEFEEWRQDELPPTTVICFEYKASNYKLLTNLGFAECHDGAFGAMFDANNDKILDVSSSGDMESTIQSLKDDKKLDDDFLKKLSPYLEYFQIILGNNTELEYLVFKVLVENDCLYQYHIDTIDEDIDEDNDNDDQ